MVIHIPTFPVQDLEPQDFRHEMVEKADIATLYLQMVLEQTRLSVKVMAALAEAVQDMVDALSLELEVVVATLAVVEEATSLGSTKVLVVAAHITQAPIQSLMVLRMSATVR